MLFLLASFAFADSPLTSTEFHAAYADHPMVKKAEESGVIDFEIARFLSRGKRGLDLKAAVINALSWDIEGKDNADRYLGHLARIHDVEPEQIASDPSLLKPHQAFALGYMTALDDYFEPSPALPQLHFARTELPDSRTVALITSLVEAQIDMNDSWCDAWKTVELVLEDEELRPDMKFEAETIIRDYMQLYAEVCPTCGELGDVQLPEGERLERRDVSRAWEREHPPVCECIREDDAPTVMFAIEIDRDGVVTDVGYAGTSEEPRECLHRAVETWRFPPWQLPKDRLMDKEWVEAQPTRWKLALEVKPPEPEADEEEAEEQKGRRR